MDDKPVEQRHLRLAVLGGEVRHGATKLAVGVDDLLGPLLMVKAKPAALRGAPG